MWQPWIVYHGPGCWKPTHGSCGSSARSATCLLLINTSTQQKFQSGCHLCIWTDNRGCFNRHRVDTERTEAWIHVDSLCLSLVLSLSFSFAWDTWNIYLQWWRFGRVFFKVIASFTDVFHGLLFKPPRRSALVTAGMTVIGWFEDSGGVSLKPLDHGSSFLLQFWF